MHIYATLSLLQRKSISFCTLPTTPRSLLFRHNSLTHLPRHSTTPRRPPIPLPNRALLGRIDETVNSTMIKHAFLSVVLAFLIGLRPHVAIKLAMALTSRTRGAREISIFLHERFFADLADDPGGFGFGQESGCQDVVAWHADRGGVVEVCGWAFEAALSLGGAVLGGSFFGCYGHL